MGNSNETIEAEIDDQSANQIQVNNKQSIIVNTGIKEPPIVEPISRREASLANPVYPGHRIGLCFAVTQYDAV